MKAFLTSTAVVLLALGCGTPALAAEPPAAMLGLWCGQIPLGRAALQIEPSGDKLKIQLRALGRAKDYEATLQGDVATVPTSKGDVGMALQLEGNKLRIVETRDSLAMLQGESFTRAAGGSCPA
ncbi:hypothetical protein [uncultured Ramlibacter sp.]|uniref:hypothetical protein n=1 Tax=uncultured Ramlibacter sp. TaxID=260755 RepID=UPI002621ECAD|nr:hypothetical protein [uncultured Ramlibacter sp.]